MIDTTTKLMCLLLWSQRSKDGRKERKKERERERQRERERERERGVN